MCRVGRPPQAGRVGPLVGGRVPEQVMGGHRDRLRSADRPDREVDEVGVGVGDMYRRHLVLPPYTAVGISVLDLVVDLDILDRLVGTISHHYERAGGEAVSSRT